MAAGAGAPDGGREGPSGERSAFECNVCCAPARDAVIGLCGHLYCWPCLHEWLARRPHCAACGAGLSRERVVPLYGRGGGRDPRLQTPPRPQGQRPEPQSCGDPPGGGSSFQVTFGLGALPFAFLSARPPAPPDAGAAPPPPGPDWLFLLVAAFIFLWLLRV